MEGIERYHAHLGFRNEGPAAGGERSPVLAVLPVVAGPALAHVAARGLGAVHAGRHVPAGIHVTRVHTPPPEVPCGDRPALPHPGTRLSHRRAAFRRGGGGGRPSARGCVRNLQPPRDPPSRLLCRGKPQRPSESQEAQTLGGPDLETRPRNHGKLGHSGGPTWKHGGEGLPGCPGAGEAEGAGGTSHASPRQSEASTQRIICKHEPFTPAPSISTCPEDTPGSVPAAGEDETALGPRLSHKTPLRAPQTYREVTVEPAPGSACLGGFKHRRRHSSQTGGCRQCQVGAHLCHTRRHSRPRCCGSGCGEGRGRRSRGPPPHSRPSP